MGWVRLDDNFADHPKVIALSDPAFRLYIQALCYSNRQLTDGFIPLPVYLNLSKEADEAELLIDAGLWESVHSTQSGSSATVGYQIRSYSEYQPTKEKVNEKRDAAKERLRKFREKQGNTVETRNKHLPQPNPTQPIPNPNINTKDNYFPETVDDEPDYLPTTLLPRNHHAKLSVQSIVEKLEIARQNGVNAWNLSKLVEEQWDELHSANDIGACIALTSWYVSELQSRKLESKEIGRIGQMTKRFGRISLLAIDEAASKDLDDLISYAFRIAQRMYADKKAGVK
jgi:hypothetical protein